jgi:hypothetical protein
MGETPNEVSRIREGRDHQDWYVYAWRGGPCILKGVESPLRPKLGMPELKAISDAREQSTAPRDAGLLSRLIRQWRGTGTPGTESPEWRRLAPTTRDTWGLCAERDRAEVGGDAARRLGRSLDGGEGNRVAR